MVLDLQMTTFITVYDRFLRWQFYVDAHFLFISDYYRFSLLMLLLV